MASFQIGTYSITHTTMANGYGWIMVMNAGAGTVNRARVNFVATDVGKIEVSSSMVTINMHVSAFDRVIDTLRNEKPLQFVWFPGKWAGICTGDEPAGEGEMP